MGMLDFENFRAAEPETEITATVTEPVDLVDDPPSDLDLEIPDFLIRNPDNSFALLPSPSCGGATATVPLPVPPPPPASCEPSPPIQPTAPEPTPAELRAEIAEQRKKSAFAKMRARQDQAKAAAAGKVWRNGRFVEPGSISRCEYNRVLRELDTPSAKRLFVHLFSEKVIGGLQ